MLRGPVGVGKSMLVAMLRRYQVTSGSLGPIVTLTMPQLRANEVLGYLAESFQNRFRSESQKTRSLEWKGKQPKECCTCLHQSLLTVESFLCRNAKEKHHAALIVEDAHQITDPELYSLFKSLLALEYNGRPVFSLLLVAETTPYSEEPRMSFVDDCIEAVATCLPLSPEETAGYIMHRLKVAGAKKDIFTSEALETIHYLTEGIPRKINRLCDLALLIGFAEKYEELASETIMALNNELIEI